MITTTVYLTEDELRTLHRRFGHLSARRLDDLLHRARQDEKKYRKLLESITKYFNNCQKHGGASLRFKFTLKDQNIDFNHSIYADIMYIDKNPVLHIIDEATRFQAARWLVNMKSSTIWEGLREIWTDLYLGLPDIITHDASTNFTYLNFSNTHHL